MRKKLSLELRQSYEPKALQSRTLQFKHDIMLKKILPSFEALPDSSLFFRSCLMKYEFSSG
jgi:hypothetical protein